MALPEVTLQSLRTLSRRFADMMFSDFVTDDELNTYLNLGLRELYDKFLEAHGQEYFLKAVNIPLVPPRTLYELPDDLVSVKNVSWSTNELPSTASVTTDGFVTTTVTYDVPIDESEDTVSLEAYTFPDLNSGSEAHLDSRYGRRWGVRPRYRVMASNKVENVLESDGGMEVISNVTTTTRVNLIRLDAEASGHLHIWYWPEVPQLSNDTDAFPLFHGYEEYPALVAAIMMLAKEESDTTALQIRLGKLTDRIETVAAQRSLTAEGVADVYTGDW